MYDIEEHGSCNRHNSPTSTRCGRYQSGIDGDEPIEDSIGLYREQFTKIGEGMKTKTGKVTGDPLGQASPRNVDRNNDIHRSFVADNKIVSVPTVTWENIQLLSPKYRAIAERLIQKNELVLVES